MLFMLPHCTHEEYHSLVFVGINIISLTLQNLIWVTFSGRVVAKFCAKYLHSQVLKSDAYSTGDLGSAVHRAFFRYMVNQIPHEMKASTFVSITVRMMMIISNYVVVLLQNG